MPTLPKDIVDKRYLDEISKIHGTKILWISTEFYNNVEWLNILPENEFKKIFDIFKGKKVYILRDYNKINKKAIIFDSLKKSLFYRNLPEKNEISSCYFYEVRKLFLEVNNG